MTSRYALKSFVLASAVTLLVAGCSSPKAVEETKPITSSNSAAPTTVTIEDNTGSHTIKLPVASVVATDNRQFETLSTWGIKLAAAPVPLIPTTLSYKTDKTIVDLGSHREPKLEAIVAANPTIIISGQRFTQHEKKISELVPSAAIINFDPREGQLLDAELKRGTTAMGELFGKQSEAKKLNDDLDTAINRAKTAYNKNDKVLAVNVSGGKIGNVAPKVGRTLGPLYEILGLTPAIEVTGSTNDHQGDEISVEAIVQANPEWILVMDRDAAITSQGATVKPAKEVIQESEVLKNIPAVQKGQVIYMPADTYLNEGIQTYTEYLSAVADAFEKAKKK
ncbi:MAG: siderophore ABC transporter substrate-binding protein [Propionibacteriaceae bacterium]